MVKREKVAWCYMPMPTLYKIGRVLALTRRGTKVLTGANQPPCTSLRQIVVPQDFTAWPTELSAHKA